MNTYLGNWNNVNNVSDVKKLMPFAAENTIMFSTYVDEKEHIKKLYNEILANDGVLIKKMPDSYYSLYLGASSGYDIQRTYYPLKTNSELSINKAFEYNRQNDWPKQFHPKYISFWQTPFKIAGPLLPKPGTVEERIYPHVQNYFVSREHRPVNVYMTADRKCSYGGDEDCYFCVKDCIESPIVFLRQNDVITPAINVFYLERNYT
jgi:hypothetical protein